MNHQKIPIIDFGAIASLNYENVEDSEFCQISKEFGKAMSEVGFACLINHGVDMDKVEHIYKLSKEFFELPQSIKQKYRKTNTTQSFHGYTGPGNEFLNDAKINSTELRESWDSWGLDSINPSKYPTEIPDFKTAIDSIRLDCNNLAKKLLRCMGKYLNLEDEEIFVNAHRSLDDPRIRSHNQFRSMHYFPLDPKNTEIPPNAIRCGEHTDWDTITLLFQDMVGGLEVRRADGSWIDAVPIKDAVLINGGQIMERWSSGVFPATPHRVRIVEEERILSSARQSFIYFVNPDADTEVTPLFSDDILQGTKSQPFNAYDYYQDKINEASLY